MKLLFVSFFSFFILLSAALAQPGYQWVLKRSGSSLGGPIDYNNLNPNLVYYGSTATIYKSTDKGETFFVTGTPVPGSSDIKSINLDDANPGTFIVAIESSPNDKIYKTTDDGVTWTLTLNEGQMSYFGIPVTHDPSNPNHLYTMVNTNFKKSTDFGSTWTTIASNFGPISAPCDIEVFADTSIILIGDNGTGIFRSTNYGLNWSQTYFTSGEIPTIAIDYTNPGIAWATKWGGGNGLLKSTDYGATWTLQSGFTQSMWGVHVQPDDGNVVITGCYSCGISWRSKTGGLTWTQIPIGSTNYQYTIIDSMNQFAAQGNGFYKLASDFFIPVELASFSAELVDQDAVLNWTTASELNNQGFEIEQSSDNEYFSKIGFVPGFGTTTELKSYSFRISNIKPGVQYYRLKQIDFDGTETIYNSVEVTGPVPNTFVLNQNHPNPFNPSTIISFSLPVESEVNIKLFNLLGQEVTQITNANFNSGNHTIEFNAEGLSSGTYIYTLEAKGVNGANFKSTKKMLLLR
ncbi:MAG TPA: T9SS type A sorting domain-containing protein [Ignavibacteriaceae bacterium]|nr:T9SS type A sorting domain-containing protein [Ignavibacteriaceae bacterium]